MKQAGRRDLTISKRTIGASPLTLGMISSQLPLCSYLRTEFSVSSRGDHLLTGRISQATEPLL
jgi:hypothetical protein